MTYHSHDGSCRPFRSEEHTLELALEIAKSLPGARTTYEKELNLANQCIEERWELIKEKQRKLRKLDNELAQKKALLAQAESSLLTALEVHCYYDRRGRTVREQAYFDAENSRNRAKLGVESIQSQIRQQESKPSNVEFALPRSRDDALSWLFFIFMPIDFFACP